MFAGVAGKHTQAVETFGAAVRFATLVVFLPGHVASITSPQGTPSLAGGSSLDCHKSFPMDTQTIRAQMPTLVRGHVPSSDPQLPSSTSSMGQPKGFDAGLPHRSQNLSRAKVIATTDAIVVKTGRPVRHCSTRRSSPNVPDEGAKVQVEPCAAPLRRPARGHPREAPSSPPAWYTVKRLILGSAPAKLPIPAPQCPEAAGTGPPTGTVARRWFPAHHALLVDAGARDFTVVDPSPSNIIATPPAIGFTVASAKFQGASPCSTNAASTSTRWNFTATANLVGRVDEVFFDAGPDAGAADRRRDLAPHPRAAPVWSQAVQHWTLRPHYGFPVLAAGSLLHPLEITSMTVRFKGTPLWPRAARGAANQCRVILSGPGRVFHGRAWRESARWAAQDHRLRRWLQPGRPIRSTTGGNWRAPSSAATTSASSSICDGVFARLLHSGITSSLGHRYTPVVAGGAAGTVRPLTASPSSLLTGGFFFVPRPQPLLRSPAPIRGRPPASARATDWRQPVYATVRIESPPASVSAAGAPAYMLWRVLQANGGLPADTVVCFANTGKESNHAALCARLR